MLLIAYSTDQTPPEKLTVSQPVKKYPSLWNLKFIIVCTKACHLYVEQFECISVDYTCQIYSVTVSNWQLYNNFLSIEFCGKALRPASNTQAKHGYEPLGYS
jgi:hypothetical protein